MLAGHGETVGRPVSGRVTGLPVRRPTPKRYEVAAPGQLVHVDVKKQGRIPDGGRWRVHGRRSAQDRAAGAIRDKAARAGAAGSRGYRYLHHTADDHSRLAYSQILDDERTQTAARFWQRANAFFAGLGVTVTAVMTDNSACYRSHVLADTLGDHIEHRWTRPLPAPDQWEGRTIQPHSRGRVGLRDHPRQRDRT